ncbi:hypothetical protein ABT332_05910 [Saccharomonospora azurea]|uniref:hypothetical protein n=1 Tax=Saccharomonospora azurea TaxID=40988 RepID=UPI00332060E6
MRAPMHAYDIDAFGMLDTPDFAQPLLEPSSDEEIVPQGEEPPRSTENSVDGDRNKVAGRDVNEITNNFIGFDSEEIAQQIARARQKQRAGRGIQDPEALQRLASKYVAPDGLLGESSDDDRTAFRILQDRRVLLLCASERDGGQLAAACRLGHELSSSARIDGSSRLIVREELVDPSLSLKPEELLVDNEPATVILDFRDADDEDLRIVQRGLVELSTQLLRYESYLIVILPPGQRSRFEDRFPGRVHELGKPLSIDVLESHVGAGELTGVRHDQDLLEKLEDLWPPAVSRVAELVRERLAQDWDSVDAVRTALEDETVGQSDKLRAVIQEKQQAEDSEWLSLLLSAAVLEGSSPQHIAAASDALLRHNRIDVPGEPAPILRPSPYARLRRLADDEWLDLSHGTLRPSGVGGEVLRHFWREHPDLRTPLWSWLRDLPDKLRALDQEALEQLADRAADLAGEAGAKLAVDLAAEWAKTKAGRESGGRRTSTATVDTSRRSIAVRLLTTAATDSTLGRRVRSRLWRWSREGDADQKLLTAEVCAGIGAAFPRNALTRLKHLANSDNQDVRDAVLRALRQLGDDLGVARLLRYLAEWFDHARPGRLAILAKGVSDVVAAQRTVVEAGAATLFWRRAVTTMPPDDLRVMVSSWLHATAQLAPDDRGSMVEPLVQATGGTSRYIAHVQYASKPEPVSLDVDRFSDDAVAAVTQQLWIRLDEIDPVWAEE